MKVFIGRDSFGHSFYVSKPKWLGEIWDGGKKSYFLESCSKAIRLFRKLFPISLKIGECQEVELSIKVKPIGKPVKGK